MIPWFNSLFDTVQGNVPRSIYLTASVFQQCKSIFPCFNNPFVFPIKDHHILGDIKGHFHCCNLIRRQIDSLECHKLFDWSHNWWDTAENIDLGNVTTCKPANIPDLNRKCYDGIAIELGFMRLGHLTNCRNVKIRRGKICIRQPIAERILQGVSHVHRIIPVGRGVSLFIFENYIQLIYKECPYNLEGPMVCSFIG